MLLKIAVFLFWGVNAIPLWSDNSCFFYFGDIWTSFDLKGLKSQHETRFDTVITVNGTSVPGRIHFRLCGQLDFPDQCLEFFSSAAAYFISEDGKQCVKILDDNRLRNNYKTNKEFPTDGFSILGTGTNTTWDLRCDSFSMYPNYTINENRVEISFDGACGTIDVSAALFSWKGVDAVVLGFGVVILASVIVSLNLALAVSCFTTSFLGTFVICTQYAENPLNKRDVIIIAVCAGLVGLALAYIGRAIERFGRLFVSFGTGTLAGLIILRALNITLYSLLDDLAIIFFGFIFMVFGLSNSFVLKAAVPSVFGCLLAGYALGQFIGGLRNIFDAWNRIRFGYYIESSFYLFLTIVSISSALLTVFKINLEKSRADDSDIQLSRFLL